MIGNLFPRPDLNLQTDNTIVPSPFLAAHLELALNAVQEAIVTVNSEGVICWHNSAFLRLIEPDPSPSKIDSTLTLCGENLITKFSLMKDHIPLSHQEHPVFLRLSHLLQAREYQFHQNGKILILEIKIFTLEDPPGEGSRVLVIRDVTEHKLIEQIISLGHLPVELSTTLDKETYDQDPDPSSVEGSPKSVHWNTSHLNTFYESVTAQLSNYSAIGHLAHLFTQMMLQLKMHEEESVKAKDKLHAVLNAVPGLISWISADETYLGVNYHLAQIFDLTPEDFIGKKLGFIKEDTRMNDFLRRFIASSQSYDSTTVELQIDRDLRHYIIAVQKYDEGNAIVAVGIDITKQKCIEEALILAEENYRSTHRVTR